MIFTPLEKEIIFNIHTLLVRRITSNFRFIFIEVKGYDLDILVYFYRPPSELEIGFLSDIDLSINAVTSELNRAKSRIKISSGDDGGLETLEYCIFARYEDSI